MADLNIYQVLLQLYAGILLGWFCARSNFISSSKGHMEGLTFYLGKIALPMIIFKDASMINFGNLHFSVIFACNLGKICACICTGVTTYWFHTVAGERHDSFRTSVLFGLFAVYSNDFLIGYPVVGALFPRSTCTIDATAYLTLNAIINVCVFLPLAVALLEIGNPRENSAVTNLNERTTQRREVLKNIFMNPLLGASIVGLLYGFVVNRGNSASLPSGLGDIVDLYSSPFTMLALFVTGASIGRVKAALTFWPLFLAVVKVVGVSLLTLGFTRCLFPANGVVDPMFTRFSFFYGSLPTCSAPVLLAKMLQMDPEISEKLAAAIFIAIMIAFPQMLVGHVFTRSSGTSRSFHFLQLNLAYGSVACAIVTIVALSKIAYRPSNTVSARSVRLQRPDLQELEVNPVHEELTTSSSVAPLSPTGSVPVTPLSPTGSVPASALLGKGPWIHWSFAYAVIVLLHNAFMVGLLQFGCPGPDKIVWTYFLTVLQNLCRFSPLVLTYFSIRGWRLQVRQSAEIAALVFAVSCVAALVVSPCGVDRFCIHTPRIWVEMVAMFAIVSFVLYLIFFAYYFYKRESSTCSDVSQGMDNFVVIILGFSCILLAFQIVNLLCQILNGRVVVLLLFFESCMNCGHGTFLCITILQFKDVSNVLKPGASLTNVPGMLYSSWDDGLHEVEQQRNTV